MKLVKEQRHDFLVTSEVKTDQEAVSYKMKALNPKLFGLFHPVPYELLSQRKVYVPYEYILFSYRISNGRRKASETLGRHDKTGEIGIIFDLNEVHGFLYDHSETLDLNTITKENADGEILEDRCSGEHVLETAKSLILHKFLHRPFSHTDLAVITRRKFYRPAWDLTVIAHGKEMHRYAWMDSYGSSSEHISGLKVRLNV